MLQIEELKILILTLQIVVLFNITSSPRSSQTPRTNGLVEVQNQKLGTHVKLFLYDDPENWSVKVHFFANAHITQPFPLLPVSTDDFIFQTQQHIPLKFP